jgi:hypothetical protein
MESRAMPFARPQALGALALAAAALLASIALAWRGDPAIGFVIPAALLLGALLLVVSARRAGPERVETIRLDLDRLRPGRLRDYCLHAGSYFRQLEALAETLPRPALRAALARDLPGAEAAVRAIYDLCLRLQAYELGEAQPAAFAGASDAEIAALTRNAERTLRSALSALRKAYSRLRRAWSEPADDGDAAETTMLADLAPLTARLRDFCDAFAPDARPPARPTARSES